MNGMYHGNDVIDIGRVAHLTSEDVHAEIAVRDSPDVHEEISDACAVTIASWWAGPRRGDGLAMAELSTSGRVRLEDLADDLSKAFDQTNDVRDGQALDMLATWALNHPSRKGAPREQTWACCTSSIGPVCQHKRGE